MYVCKINLNVYDITTNIKVFSLLKYLIAREITSLISQKSKFYSKAVVKKNNNKINNFPYVYQQVPTTKGTTVTTSNLKEKNISKLRLVQ